MGKYSSRSDLPLFQCLKVKLVGVLVMEVSSVSSSPLQIGSPFNLPVPLAGNLKLYLNALCSVGILGSE